MVFLESVWFNPDPPSLDAPFSGLILELLGPFPLDITPELLISLDVAGDAREELVILVGGEMVWFDVATDAGGFLPALSEPPIAWAALDWGGTPRVDLVAATAAGLAVLDLDSAPLAWSASVGLDFVPTSLAAAPLTGEASLDLVALADSGIRVSARPLGAPVWQLLPQPPVRVDSLAVSDVALGAPTRPPSESLRALVAYAGERRFFYDTDAELWNEVRSSRFVLRGTTPFDVRHPVPPRLGAFVLPEPTEALLPSFRNVAVELGLDEPLDPGGDAHCPGAVFTDLTGDGVPDLYLVRGFEGAGPENLLYTGDGAGGFIRVPGALGANDVGNGAGALALDIDNDGDRDLYVVNHDGPNRLLRNDAGSFVDVTDATDPTPDDPPGDLQEGLAYGVSSLGCEPGESLPCRLDDSLSASAGDFDRDGDLDLYVGNHLCCHFPDGERGVLYRNEGDGTFTDITLEAGIARPGARNPSNQALVIADFDADGWPDLYLANKDNGPSRDQLFLNAGDADGDGVWDGRFDDWIRAQPLPMGDVTSAAMGVAAGDYDGDGDLDLFLTDVGEMDLLRNRLVDDGVFSLEIVAPNPVASPNFSWGTSWADFDNDADLDLHVATAGGGMDWLQRNEGGGVFRDVAYASGLGQAWESRASLPADYDRDGWVDLAVVQLGTLPVSIFHNESATLSSAHWLQLVLRGSPELPGPHRSSRDAVGARVEVSSRGGIQRRDVILGGHSCASTSDEVLAFGLGEDARADEVVVHWPSGRTTRLADVAADQLLEIVELPEPDAGLLAVAALVALLGLRVRRAPSRRADAPPSATSCRPPASPRGGPLGAGAQFPR